MSLVSSKTRTIISKREHVTVAHLYVWAGVPVAGPMWVKVGVVCVMSSKWMQILIRYAIGGIINA